MTYKVINLIGIPGEMLVDEVEWIPSEENELISCFGLAIGCESLVHEIANFEIDCWFKTFLFHPLTTVATCCKSLVATN